MKNHAKIESTTILNIFECYNDIYTALNKICKKHDLTFEQYNVLKFLSLQTETVNMGTIQDQMLAPNSNSTRIVDKLVKKLLVNRNQCPKNKRLIKVNITSQGISYLKNVSEAIETLENKLSKNLSLGELMHLNELIIKYKKP